MKNVFRMLSMIVFFSLVVCMYPTNVLANTDAYVPLETNEEEENEILYEEIIEEPTEMDEVIIEEQKEEIVQPEQEDEIKMPAFHTEKSFGQGSITITAQEGVLPEGTSAQIQPVSYDGLQDVLDSLLMSEGNASIDACMYDVNLFDKDGNQIQPNGSVTITLTGIQMDISQEYADYISYKAIRLNQDGTYTSLNDQVDISQGSVSFYNDHFTNVGVVAYANIDEINALNDVSTYALEKKESNGYSVYQEGQTYVNPVYIKDDGSTYIAYCFNGYRAYPGLKDSNNKNNYVGKYESVTEAELKQENKKLRRDGLENLKKTVNYGYPYNAGGIQEKYNLTDMQYRAVTQAAIWYYTDRMPLSDGVTLPDDFSVDYGSFRYNSAILWLTYEVDYDYSYPIKIVGRRVFTWTDDMTKAYYELLNNEDYTYPEGFTLDLYTADDEGFDTPDYQHLLSVKQEVIPTVEISKEWDDDGNAYSTRAESVTVDLYANGEKTNKSVVLNEENNWKSTFTDLVKSKDGKDIEYTIKEQSVNGYISKVTGSVEDGFTIKNTLVSVQVSKVDITNGKELEGAVIQILDENGKVVEEWTSTTSSHKVVGLSVGKTYTLREKVAPKGYEITADTTFELNADGTINTSKTTTKVKDGILLVEDSITPIQKTQGTPTGADNGMKFYGSLFTVSMAGAAWMLALRKKAK